MMGYAALGQDVRMQSGTTARRRSMKRNGGGVGRLAKGESAKSTVCLPIDSSTSETQNCSNPEMPERRLAGSRENRSVGGITAIFVSTRRNRGRSDRVEISRDFPRFQLGRICPNVDYSTNHDINWEFQLVFVKHGSLLGTKTNTRARAYTRVKLYAFVGIFNQFIALLIE